jgi:hypothetical protein
MNICALLGLVIAAQPVAVDVRVDGDGYLRFIRDGKVVYAKSSKLVVRDGRLVSDDQLPLLPGIAVPAAFDAIQIDLQGNVFSVRQGNRAKLGRLVIALFESSTLTQEGRYFQSSARPVLAEPGEGKAGVIRSGSAAPPTVAPASQQIPRQQEAEVRLRIQIAPDSEVEGDKVLLRHVAVIEPQGPLAEQLGQVEITDTPAIGVVRTLDMASVTRRLRAAGHKPENMTITVPSGAKIRRKAQTVEHQEFVDVAMAAARERVGGDLTLASRSAGSPFPAPLGSLELKAETTTVAGKNVTVVVAVHVDGVRRNSRTIHFTIDGDPVIRSGAAVKILLRSGGVVVEVDGRARSAGYIGQSIEVATSSGTTHTGTVLDGGRVEVRL